MAIRKVVVMIVTDKPRVTHTLRLPFLLDAHYLSICPSFTNYMLLAHTPFVWLPSVTL
jgi:hypothetical protein